jgi:putative transposase
MTELRQ